MQMRFQSFFMLINRPGPGFRFVHKQLVNVPTSATRRVKLRDAASTRA